MGSLLAAQLVDGLLEHTPLADLKTAAKTLSGSIMASAPSAQSSMRNPLRPRAAQAAGAAELGVATIDEALSLRRDGITAPVLAVTGAEAWDTWWARPGGPVAGRR